MVNSCGHKEPDTTERLNWTETYWEMVSPFRVGSVLCRLSALALVLVHIVAESWCGSLLAACLWVSCVMWCSLSFTWGGEVARIHTGLWWCCDRAWQALSRAALETAEYMWLSLGLLSVSVICLGIASHWHLLKFPQAWEMLTLPSCVSGKSSLKPV